MSKNQTLRNLVRLTAVSGAVLWAIVAYAQGAPDAPPVAPEAAEPATYRSMFEILRSGGLMMIPLFACSFLMLVFIFERAISLRRGRVVPGPFVKRFLHQVREGKFDRESALVLCEESASPIADVFCAVVKKWGRPSAEIEQTIIDAEDRIAPTLRRYVRLFSSIATISPLLGLVGTVFGMIRLFDAISAADAMGRTELLASGISEALLTTAAGLLIAIPALVFHQIFVSRVERLLLTVDEIAQELAGLISAEALHDERRRGKSRPTTAA
jgi:biopolymer transport protein ExbB